MTYTSTQMTAVTVCAALACLACLLIGMCLGWGRGFKHGTFDAQLAQAQKDTRHRLRPEAAQPDGDTAIMERYAPTAYIQTPDWHGEDWDLDGFLARMTADNDQFLHDLHLGDST